MVSFTLGSMGRLMGSLSPCFITIQQPSMARAKFRLIKQLRSIKANAGLCSRSKTSLIPRLSETTPCSVVNIRRLREKIDKEPAKPVYIKNVRGLGYVWDVDVK